MQGQLYQWQKGEYIEQYSKAIDVEEEGEMSFLIFEDGRRINIELIEEFLIPVNSEDEGYIIREEVIDDLVEMKGKDGGIYTVPGPDHGKRRITKKPKTKQAKPIITSTPKQQIKEEPKNLYPNDPIIALLEKSKKVTKPINITLRLDIITQGTYDLIIDNFEDSEESIVEYLISSIDKKELVESIKVQLKGSYSKTPITV